VGTFVAKLAVRGKIDHCRPAFRSLGATEALRPFGHNPGTTASAKMVPISVRPLSLLPAKKARPLPQVGRGRVENMPKMWPETWTH